MTEAGQLMDQTMVLILLFSMLKLNMIFQNAIFSILVPNLE